MPIRYDPALERPEPDEAETIEGLVAALRQIAETVHADSGHAERAVHAKAHALLHGELEVLGHLPPTLAQGIFSTPRRFDAVLRFSTNPGDVLADSVSVPRGLAVKVLGVEGARLPGSEAATTQDFVLANAPVFLAPDPRAFLSSLKLLAATTDRAPGLKQAASAVLRQVEKLAEAVGGGSATLRSLGGHPTTHVLGETYWSQVPLRHGDYVAKLSVAPRSPTLRALEGVEVDVSDDPDALRRAADAVLRREGGEWEVRVQLLTDRDTMPVEDASVAWPEEQSPYIPIARLRAPPQPAWAEAARRAVDEGMAFSPWHGLEAHRPLGGIMRARRAAYAASSRFRLTRNGCPVREPEALDWR
ncbi:catalase family protein [Pseudoroseomonas cervicalis]|uniref:catalase family protein n=1 Tax=Teichococcus cervicalis TaxID=204525 RepID=UPI0035ED9C96